MELNVLNEDWEILIILDACRYDIFKENYQEFLSGKIELRHSLGTNTKEWFKKTFPDYYKDIIYISGNPYCNGKGVTAGGFKATDHFYKVIDAWDFGFDKILGIIHPQALNKSFFKYQTLYPNKRFIIHYIQPHSPYISIENEYKKKFLQIQSKKKKLKKRRFIFNFWKKTRLPNSILWRISNKFGTNSYIAQIYLDKGWKGLIDAYINNLRFVLPYIKKIVENCPQKKIIITSDHGERLGELDMFGHGGARDKVVIEVPLLRIH